MQLAIELPIVMCLVEAVGVGFLHRRMFVSLTRKVGPLRMLIDAVDESVEQWHAQVDNGCFHARLLMVYRVG